LNGGLGILGWNEVEVALARRRAQTGHRALIDAMGVDDDPARSGLPEHLRQSHYGHGARADDIGQHLSRSDGRHLVDIADDQQRRLVRDRFHERLHQHDIDHRGLVDHKQIAVEGIVGVAFEAAALGIDLQESVDRLGLDARRFGYALRRVASGGAEQ
jgi:hypothetical protein